MDWYRSNYIWSFDDLFAGIKPETISPMTDTTGHSSKVLGWSAAFQNNFFRLKSGYYRLVL